MSLKGEGELKKFEKGERGTFLNLHRGPGRCGLSLEKKWGLKFRESLGKGLQD